MVCRAVRGLGLRPSIFSGYQLFRPAFWPVQALNLRPQLAYQGNPYCAFPDLSQCLCLGPAVRLARQCERITIKQEGEEEGRVRSGYSLEIGDLLFW